MKNRARPKSVDLGAELLKGLESFRDTLRAGTPVGQRFTVRSVRRPVEPSAYSARQLKALRVKFGASQAVFAMLLGVSAKTLQSWEQGSSVPPMARRLLDVIRNDPSPWRKMLKGGEPLRKAS
jgi:putative transcriptional regulator